MFSLREFIKKGLIDAVGKMADYQVILNATGWYEKGVLIEDDLAELQNYIEGKIYSEFEDMSIPEDVIETENVVENTGEAEEFEHMDETAE